jgi:hypothetical protein
MLSGASIHDGSGSHANRSTESSAKPTQVATCSSFSFLRPPTQMRGTSLLLGKCRRPNGVATGEVCSCGNNER